IAVFTPMATGHVYAALGLCAELAGRGHRVTYPTNENFVARIREAGAVAVEFKAPEFRHVEKVVRGTSSSDAKFLRAFTSVSFPMIIAKAAVATAELEGFYAKDPPDLIIYDWWAFAGRILARNLGCRAVQIGSHFAHHDSLMRIGGVCITPEPMLAFNQLLDS